MDSINIIYTNADTLTHKMRELFLIVSDMEPDIIMITEVRPKYSKTEVCGEQFKLCGFELFTNVNDENAGRGVASLYICGRPLSNQHQSN